MNVNYRGFEIRVVREKCMAGYKLVYYSIFRKSDGYEVESGYSDSADTVRDWVKWMKERVDGFIADPAEEILQTTFSGAPKYEDEEYAELIASHRKENQKAESLYA